MKRAVLGALALVLVSGGLVCAVTSQSGVAVSESKGTERAKAPAASPKSADDAQARRKAREVAARRARELARVRRTLRARPAETKFEAMPVKDALRMLGKMGRFGVVFDPALEEEGIDLSTRLITMRLRGMRYEDALYLILPREYGYRIEAGFVLITTLQKSWLPLKTVVYGVRLALTRPPNFIGPRFEVGDLTSRASQGGGGFELFGNAGADEEEEEDQMTPERLIDLIMKHVRHGNDRRIATWDDEGGPATISYLDGKLIVSQTDHGHRAVARLLMQIG